MGKYNSSIYRVRPLMEQVEGNQQNFLGLLALVGIGPLGVPQMYRYEGKPCGEMQLKPSKKHLLALIDYIAKKDHSDRAVKGGDRLALFFGDRPDRERARRKARAELNAHYDELSPASRPWYLFEGFTNPDIYIEGEDYVVICEGKWTESHITTTTTYLSDKGEYRSQMVRHIQGALNHTGKKVYAFYIVDADCGYTDDLSKKQLQLQLDRETIRLDDAEKKAILDSFYGYTTWQEIKAMIPEVVFKGKHEID